MKIQKIISQNFVESEVFLPIYQAIPREKKQLLKEFLGLRNLHNAFNKHVITFERYEQLQKFVNILYYNAFSKVVETEVTDYYQQRKYLLALGDLINSSEYLKLSQKDRSRIIYEYDKIASHLRKLEN